ncbi:Vitamin B12 import ATP-binding protein BtuD [Candidatus Lokiarchaeum ossiferum]|uniref:Vitamin B12 import ATP-binding protein BtuD n=1 Tax=Candidatus Lokiarchaeum ossiferum TaxID=2951803 RepID=A0ABY6HYR3_9ARCH|nr:Vitamin B12 import ATP-binding protein BtuD [Candidatus Lokiarchaeum sp. B-35]
MNGIKWVSRLFLKYKGQTFYVATFAIVEVLLFMVPISITADVIEIAIEGGGLAAAKGKIWLLLGLAIIQALIFFSISFINEVLAHRIQTDMTQELFESLQFRSLTYHNTKDVGNIMARATGDTRTINIAISPAIRFLLASFVIWVVAFILTLQIHWILFMYSIFIFVLFGITSYFYVQNLIPISLKTRESFAEISETVNNNLTGVKELKSFVAIGWAKRKMGKKSQQLMQNEIREGNKMAWFYPILIVTFYCASILIISIFLNFQGGYGIGIPDIVRIAGSVSLLLGMSEELGWCLEFLIRGKTAADRIYSIVSEKDSGAFSDGKNIFDNKPSTIEFKNVDFRYREDLPKVLKQISLKVEENQTVAVVGGPGSGKSTLTQLIQRLYIPTAGEILLGGIPIQDYTNESLRKNISTVEQDIFLFNSSVKDNIRYGKPDASDEEVFKVAKIAEADEFIKELPNGYENLIGEGGVRLSGGQAQRLSIARALLVNPSILLMDDGASALDSRTEARIQKAITEILKTRTTLITTHRLAIIAKADLVIILEKGEIVGLGTHESLIRTNSYYRRLFEKHYDLPKLEQTTSTEVAIDV